MHSDTAADRHSPRDGIWHSHMGWLLDESLTNTRWGRVPGLPSFGGGGLRWGPDALPAVPGSHCQRCACWGPRRSRLRALIRTPHPHRHPLALWGIP